ncbi:MAG TPA: PTS lactose transporter subunit IIB, partial [Thomasclavelia ramosa]|nr:PTS lactose transporter subunit IIB [Thomasclavelia ramosa]
MNKGGQYQVIIGTHLNEVIKFVNQELGFKGDEKATEDKVEEKGNLFNRFFKVISGCIMPMIGPMLQGG